MLPGRHGGGKHRPGVSVPLLRSSSVPLPRLWGPPRGGGSGGEGWFGPCLYGPLKKTVLLGGSITPVPLSRNDRASVCPSRGGHWGQVQEGIRGGPGAGSAAATSQGSWGLVSISIACSKAHAWAAPRGLLGRPSEVFEVKASREPDEVAHGQGQSPQSPACWPCSPQVAPG